MSRFDKLSLDEAHVIEEALLAYNEGVMEKDDYYNASDRRSMLRHRGVLLTELKSYIEWLFANKER